MNASKNITERDFSYGAYDDFYYLLILIVPSNLGHKKSHVDVVPLLDHDVELHRQKRALALNLRRADCYPLRDGDGDARDARDAL